MHGNTITTRGGIKTREFSAICDETKSFFDISRASGAWPGSVHVEMTGEEVTECVGGSKPDHIANNDLDRRYETGCDPRLNGSQSLEYAMIVGDLLQQQ
jgi:3-deoxy-7-phosphoheptulonate synthase